MGIREDLSREDLPRLVFSLATSRTSLTQAHNSPTVEIPQAWSGWSVLGRGVSVDKAYVGELGGVDMVGKAHYTQAHLGISTH